MNISELLQEHGVDYRTAGQHHHVGAGYTGVDCPRCSPNTQRFRLGIRDDLYCFCWVCGRLNSAEVLAELTGRPQREFYGLWKTLSPSAPIARKVRGVLKRPADLGPMRKPHKDYLQSRDFCPDALTRIWGLLGTGPASQYPWRVYIPIVFERREVSWTARSIHPHTKKRYHNASALEEEYPAKETLYGWDRVGNVICIHEGPADVWRTGPGAVATFGLVWTPSQLHLIARVSRRIICLDGEPAAQVRARLLAEELTPLPGETLLVELDAKDAGSAPAREIQQLHKIMGV